MRIGLISDTHGLLRPEVMAFLHGSDHIVHAGDIGGPSILEMLATLAPLTVVRGNNDGDVWANDIAATARVRFGRIALYAIHELSELDIDPAAEHVDVVISGHSHRPHAYRREGVLYVNPGSAGPRRFSLPVAAAELLIEENSVTAHVREFSAAVAPPRKSRPRVRRG